jgi:ketosteroid isomerase-like protein
MADSAAIREFVENLLELRNRADTDAIFALMDPSFHFRICGTDRLDPFTRAASDPNQVQATITALVGDWDLSGLENLSIHVGGDTAFVHRKGDVRHIPSGKVINTELMDKITVRDGRLVEYLQFVDTFLVAHTIGMA